MVVSNGSWWPWSSTATASAHEQSTTRPREGGPISQEQPVTLTHAPTTEPSDRTASPPLPKTTRAPTSSAAPPSPESSIATMPETMSCSQAFDLAMACGGLGGSFNAVYRYGHWRDCSQQWADWRFCMRTRVHADEAEKRALIREHYWQKEQRVRARASSEDVWAEREQRVTGFFQRDPDRDGVFEGLWARAPPELEEKE